ncbi:MAG: apolipoprotein N-acyltransferase [Candidatus Omnitrophota bacterium]
MFIKKYFTNISLAVLSGVLGFLSFPPFEFGFLAWFFLVPLLVAVKRSAGYREAFFYSYLSALAFWGCLLYWLANVTVPGTLVVVMIMACYTGVFGVFSRGVLKYSMDLFLLPFVWVVLEYIRGYFLTGFPWGLLAYSQYKNLNIIQVSDITGPYGVSFLLVVFNAAIFSLLLRSRKKYVYMAAALFFIIIASAYGSYCLKNCRVWGDVKISVVQGNIPQSEKWDPDLSENILKKYIALTKQAEKDRPDLIVWPETSYPYLVEGPEDVAKTIDELLPGENIPVLAGVIYGEDGRYYNSAILAGGEAGSGLIYNKTHLVPFGEYVPGDRLLAVLREFIDKPIGDFDRGSEYTLFPVRSVSSSTAGMVRTRQMNFYKFGVLICFEDVFPYITREFVRTGADIVINITNDAWFGRTAASRQHLQSSVFRAVENRVPVVRAANTGISCFIDSRGRVLSYVEKDGKETFISGIATENVETCRGKSFYTAYGDMFIYFCGFMIILLIITEVIFYKPTVASFIQRS